MSGFLEELRAFTAHWSFNFTFFMAFLAVLLLACLVAPLIRRAMGKRDE